MANLTLAIDANLLKRARMRALDEGTSVNAVVREFLTNYSVGSEGTARVLVDGRRDEIVALAARHGARSIALFGSAARGDDGSDSDIDFLVDFEPGRSLFDLARLQDELVALLDRPVDIVSVGALKSRDEAIRREAIVL